MMLFRVRNPVIVGIVLMTAAALGLYDAIWDDPKQPTGQLDQRPPSGTDETKSTSTTHGTSRLPSRTFPLVEARRAHTPKFLRKRRGDTPPPAPPPDIFRLITYPSPVGDLAAYVTPDPKDGTRRPAVLWIAGGFGNDIGEGAWRNASSDDDQSARAFREAGLVLMLPSMRGGNTNPGHLEDFYGEVNDILAAADYLASLSYVDPTRIYLGGHSTGGTLALLVAECTDRFRAVFSFGPVTDVSGYDHDELSFDVSDSKEVERRSPNRFLSTIKSPTFIFEGALAYGSTATALKEFQEVVGRAPVTMHTVRGTDHWSVLAPITRRLAGRILADTNLRSAIDFSDQDIDMALAIHATNPGSSASAL